MREAFSISIAQCVQLLGLPISPKDDMRKKSFNCTCPFCQDRGWHLNIDNAKNAYRCVKCGQSGGTLDLYGRLAHGVACTTGPSGNSKKLFKALCGDLKIGDPQNVAASPRPAPPQEILRTTDLQCNLVYSTLLGMSEFRLSMKHRSALRHRGLADGYINRNHYGTFLLTRCLDNLTSKESLGQRLYTQAVRDARKQAAVIKGYAQSRVIAGITIAEYLHQVKRLDLRGVPGFFTLAGVWCFRLEDGMYIPTRNAAGQIVALQVRKDEGKVRYKTISSKGLPDGVTTGIGRAHMPLANASIDKNSMVYLTEGPLKADVAVALLHEPSAVFIAIHGVNNTAELPGIFKQLRDAGVTRIYDALDMDKFTNVNVMKGAKHIHELAKNAGLTCRVLLWGEDRADVVANRLMRECSENGVKIPTYDKNTLGFIKRMSIALYSAGKSYDNSWSDTCKGIDDYLYTQQMA